MVLCTSRSVNISMIKCLATPEGTARGPGRSRRREVGRGEVVIVTRTGKRVLAALLVVAAIVWLPLNQPIEGPTLLVLSRNHAITTADLLSVALVVVALGLLRSARRR